MAFGIIGKKIGMTQIFTPDGTRHAVTVVEAGPCVVLQKKTVETDGYTALQLGFESKPVQWKSRAQAKAGQKMSGTRKKNTVTQAMIGHFKAAGKGAFRHVKEFRMDSVDDFNVGDEINIAGFSRGAVVSVTGTSKGKGFQGVVKRHGFGTKAMTHGSRLHRLPGSIGQHTWPARVFKNKRLPGQTGNSQVTVRDLYVLSVDKANNLLYIRGAVPGSTHGVVYIHLAELGKKKQ